MFDTQKKILDHLEKHFCFDDRVPGALFIGCNRGMNGSSWTIDDERKIRAFLENTTKKIESPNASFA